MEFLGWLGDQWWFWTLGGLCCMLVPVVGTALIVVLVVYLSRPRQ